jgi:hypothetical protein
MESFDILSLDGGGTWALIQARILQEKYGKDTTGHTVLKDFDLVIANSGGSLVLAYLCSNATLGEIVRTFNDTEVLQSIFKKKFISHIPKLKEFLPNYDTENKFKVFKKYLVNKTNGVDYGSQLLTALPALIGKELLQIIITGFDYDKERAVYFRSNDKSMMEGYKVQEAVTGSAIYDFKAVTLAQAIHASSNAPVQFFDDPAQFPLTKLNEGATLTKNHLFWDGAVGGNNNPVKSAVLEALANGFSRDKIRIVSIGTANTIRPILYKEQNEAKPEPGCDFLCRTSKIDGWIEDLSRMASSILSDPPDAATFDAHQILGLPYEHNCKRLIRINPLVKPILIDNVWTMPGEKEEGKKWTNDEMKTLFTMDMAIATTEGVRLINKLCDSFFNDKFDNQGIRLGGEKVEAILGHKVYSQAMTDWNSW